MIPMPTEREKKACPNAPTNVLPLNDSGRMVSIKVSPSFAPGSVTARITQAKRRRNSAGIRTLLTRSIPEDTPFTTT